MNKSLILSLLLCCSITLNSNAREFGSYSLGFKGGISIPNLTSGETGNVWSKNYQSRQGPYFGAVAEYRFSKHFYFQPELVYAAEGGRREGIQPMAIPEKYLELFQTAFNTDRDYLFANLNSVSRLNYLQIPMMLKFQYPLAFKGKLQFFVQGGPSLAYLLISKQEVNSPSLSVFIEEDPKTEIAQALVHDFFGSSIDTIIEARNELHQWNVGLHGAVGLAWELPKGKFFIEGGGNYGFVPVQKTGIHGQNNIGAATLVVGYLRKIHR